uniref:Uncharacterized protein n=1 Tax=Arundo donax TaxID=35708 RepID=A0A0A8Z163_ARUDO
MCIIICNKLMNLTIKLYSCASRSSLDPFLLHQLPDFCYLLPIPSCRISVQQ